MDIIILDLPKAFDRVSHQDWPQWHRGTDIQIPVLDLPAGYGRWFCISKAYVVSRVSQERVLGPLLCMLLINDCVLDCVKACQGQKTRLFVDDCLYQANRSPGLPSAQLQDDLNRLDDWKEKWRMFFHPEKYSLSNNQNQQYVLYDYSLKRQIDLHTESHSKCLGVDLNSNHLWNTCTCIHTEGIVK